MMSEKNSSTNSFNLSNSSQSEKKNKNTPESKSVISLNMQKRQMYLLSWLEMISSSSLKYKMMELGLILTKNEKALACTISPFGQIYTTVW